MSPSQTNKIKNLIIAFGVCLGVFTISSFDNWEISLYFSSPSNTREMKVNMPEPTSEKLTTLENDIQVKTNHNFIASYLMQESSIERKNKKSKLKTDIIARIKRFQKLIVAHALMHI